MVVLMKEAAKAAPKQHSDYSTTFLKPYPMSTLFDDAGSCTERETVRAALVWIDEHPEIYANMLRLAWEEFSETGYVSIEGLCWWARFQYRVKINNNHKAVLARIMQHDIPALEKGFRNRDTRLDEWLVL